MVRINGRNDTIVEILESPNVVVYRTTRPGVTSRQGEQKVKGPTSSSVLDLV